MANKIWVGTTGDVNLASNWSPSGVPAAADNVYVPIGSGSMSSNMAALKTATLGGALAIVEIQDGYTGTIGSKDAYFQFTCTTFRCGGTGNIWVDLEASAISFEIRQTGNLYLKGSALATLVAAGGNVALANYGGETSTVTTARVVGSSAKLTLGVGVTVTTAQVVSGTLTSYVGGTTLDLQGGTASVFGSGTWTTVTVDAGTLKPASTGTITTMNLNGGLVDALVNGLARTVTTMNHNGGTLRYDENVLTITTYNRKDGPSMISVSDP